MNKVYLSPRAHWYPWQILDPAASASRTPAATTVVAPASGAFAGEDIRATHLVADHAAHDGPYWPGDDGPDAGADADTFRLARLGCAVLNERHQDEGRRYCCNLQGRVHVRPLLNERAWDSAMHHKSVPHEATTQWPNAHGSSLPITMTCVQVGRAGVTPVRRGQSPSSALEDTTRHRRKVV
jgi:hypothetical protein